MKKFCFQMGCDSFNRKASLILMLLLLMSFYSFVHSFIRQYTELNENVENDCFMNWMHGDLLVKCHKRIIIHIQSDKDDDVDDDDDDKEKCFLWHNISRILCLYECIVFYPGEKAMRCKSWQPCIFSNNEAKMPFDIKRIKSNRVT